MKATKSAQVKVQGLDNVEIDESLPHVEGQAREMYVDIHTEDGVKLYHHITAKDNVAFVVQTSKCYKPESWIEQQYGEISALKVRTVRYVNGDSAKCREEFRAQPNAIWHNQSSSRR